MRTPPLLADFSHARACKPFCENSLTLPELAGETSPLDGAQPPSRTPAKGEQFIKQTGAPPKWAALLLLGERK